MYLYLYLLVEVLVFAELLPLRPYFSGALFAGWFSFLVMIAGASFLQFFVLPFSGRQDNVAVLRATLDDLRPTHIYVDSAASALIYDYRLPANARDSFMGLDGVWGRFPQRKDFPQNSVMVVSTQTAKQFFFWSMMKDPSQFHFVPMPIFGGLSSVTAANPFDLILIPLN